VSTSWPRWNTWIRGILIGPDAWRKRFGPGLRYAMEASVDSNSAYGLLMLIQDRAAMLLGRIRESRCQGSSV